MTHGPGDPAPPLPEALPAAVAARARDAAQARAFVALLHALTPRTPVTRALVAACVAVFAAMAASGVSVFLPDGASVVAWGGNQPVRTAAGEWWRLLTACFVHVGVAHLALNGYVLWQAGPLVERLFGPWGFAVLWGLSGLGGSVASMALHDPTTVSAGASGAVFGLFGGLVAVLVRDGRRSIPAPILRALWRGAALFVGLNLALSFAVAFVDAWGHLGGLAGGFLAGLGLAHPITPPGARSRPRRAVATAAVGLAVLAAAYAVAAGPPRAAAAAGEAVERAWAAQDHARKAYLAAWTAYEQGGAPAAAYARRLREEVVPAWRAARVPAEAVAATRGARQAWARAFDAYARAQEELAAATADEVEAGTRQARDRARAAEARALEAVRALEALEDAAP